MDFPVGTRVRVVDVDGQEWDGMPLNTPEKSRPHIGKEGEITAYGKFVDESGYPVMVQVVRTHNDKPYWTHEPATTPVLTLDDGTEIWGVECWWEPL
jgi:hypothetical protein